MTDFFRGRQHSALLAVGDHAPVRGRRGCLEASGAL